MQIGQPKNSRAWSERATLKSIGIVQPENDAAEHEKHLHGSSGKRVKNKHHGCRILELKERIAVTE